MDVNLTEAAPLRDNDTRATEAAERNLLLQAHAEALEEAKGTSPRPWPTFFPLG